MRNVEHHNPEVGDLVALQGKSPSARTVYNVVGMDLLYMYKAPLIDRGYILTSSETDGKQRGLLVSAYRLGPAVGRHPKGAKRTPTANSHWLSFELEPA